MPGSSVLDRGQEMPDTGRIRISLTSAELEVEGPVEFVGKYSDAIGAMLGKLRDQPTPAPTRRGIGTPAEVPGSAGHAIGAELGEFGEVLHALPRSVTGVDHVLVAGYYASQASPDKTFATGDANKLLIDQGIKLSNASQALKNNLAAKRVFKSGRGYKVSKTGEE